MDITRKSTSVKGKHENLIGKKFGRLFVTGYSHSNNGHRFWKCVCDCGNEVLIRTSALTSGNTKSCGCYKHERDLIRPKKYDEIEKEKRNLYANYKNSSNQRDINFELNYEDFINLVSGSCHYCGIEPQAGVSFIHNGIDRVDNEGGYTLNNCVTCCYICNYAKRGMSKEQFINWIKRIYINLYHKITDITPGQLIDSLITTDMKCWWSQEKLMDMSISDEERAKEAIKTQELNVKRTKLIRTIDAVLDYNEDTNTEKTYDKDK